MEHMIAKMLQNFEEGKMTRRQLIQSLALASTAAQAVAAAPPDVPPAIYFSKKDMDTNFDHHKLGDVLYQSNYGAKKYILKTNSLPKPSITPEIHQGFSEVFYVVKGKATIVTGGKLDVLTKETWPAHAKAMGLPPDRPMMSGETIGGTNIEGGESHHLSEGDVIIIPNGLPFWIKEVQESPFWFFNVRVPV